MLPLDRNSAKPQFCKIPRSCYGKSRICGHQGERSCRTQPRCGCCLGDTNDSRSCPYQFSGDLKVQRPISCNEHAIAGDDAIASQESLASSCRHDARKRPAGENAGLLESACGNDEYSRQEIACSPLPDDANDKALLLPEGSPDQRLAVYLDAPILHAGDQVSARAALDIRSTRRDGKAGRRLLIVLTSGSRSLIHHEDARPDLCCGERGVKASRPGANDENIQLLLRRAVLQAQVLGHNGPQRLLAWHDAVAPPCRPQPLSCRSGQRLGRRPSPDNRGTPPCHRKRRADRRSSPYPGCAHHVRPMQPQSYRRVEP